MADILPCLGECETLHTTPDAYNINFGFDTFKQMPRYLQFKASRWIKDQQKGLAIVKVGYKYNLAEYT